MPSVTLNIVTKAEFASYTVLRDTVMTLKGQVSGRPAESAITGFDLSALLKHLTVQ